MNTNDTPSPMPEETRCPQCGAVLSPNAPAGLCPACLLRQGVDFDSATLAPSHSFEPLSIGEIAPLFPQLEILEFIGKGGMGAVYKARQKELDRIVALKILPPSLGEAPAFAERFAREAKALAKLNHPGIVTIHEFGRADGLYYFLMEFVDGVNLRQLLAGGRVSPREALAIVPEICDALQFAHDHGIVHRDIKPANILIDRRGRVKVADFGLAKLIEAGTEAIAAEHGGGAEAGSPLTEAGKVMGTPSYMAPEQTERPEEVDHRADIYSLGVVLYELLTGELPSGQLLAPSRKVRIDVRLDAAVLRALERSPELRYQQASEMKTQVETISSTPAAAGSVPLVPPPLHAPQAALPESRFSRTAIVGAAWAGLFLLAALPAYFFTSVTAVSAGQPAPGIGPLEILLITLLLIPGLTAPFGTTILGSIALSQIRRSGGRLYGLGLAVFDVLLFPLLALDVVIVTCGVLFYHAIGPVLRNWWPASYLNLINVLILMLAFLVCTVVDYQIIRRVWREAKRPAAPPTSERPKPQHTSKRWQVAGAAGALVLILALVAVFSPSSLRRPNVVNSSQDDFPVAAQLPQGSIELVGISYHPSKDQPWWSPDGAPIGKGKFVTEGGFGVTREGQQQREFVFRLKNLPEDASRPKWQLDGSTGWAGGNARYEDNKITPELYMFAAMFPKAVKSVNIKAGIAMGPWDTLAEAQPNSTALQSTSRRGTSYTVSFTRAVDVEGCASITVVHTADTANTRVVAVDVDGKEHLTHRSDYAGSLGFAHITAIFDGLPLAKVKAFRFQISSYHWIEFRDVALNPESDTRVSRITPVD